MDKDKILELCKKILKDNNKITQELCSKNGIHKNKIKKYFGSILNLYKEIGYDSNFHRNVSKDELIKDILEWNRRTGSTLSSKYRKEGKYSCSIVNKFGGWINIMKELNLPVINDNFSDEYIKNELTNLYNKNGFLSYKLINDNCDFTCQTVKFRFGSLQNIDKLINKDNAFDSRCSSKGAIWLLNVLKNNNIKCVLEYTWDWLLYEGRHMYVDFYLPNYNIAIEYNGDQHYRYSEFIFKTYDKFIRAKNRDIEKEKLLREHNIKLYIIKYSEPLNNTTENKLINFILNQPCI